MISLKNLNHNPLLEEVNRRSETNILECYQCGKCVATCPVSGYMEVTPRQVMQYIKLNMKEPVFKANSTWFCLTCSACSARCPREIEIPTVMETLRHMAIADKIFPDSDKVDEIRKFHEIFISMVKKYGRLFELRLMAEFNIRTANFFKDVALAPKTILKGKLGLFPDKTKNKKAIDKLFEIAEKLDKESK